MNRKKNNCDPEHILYDAILSLQDKDECCRFLLDLCTPKELSAMEQRFEVAQMLYHGKTYTDILEATGASSAIISRVNRSLTDGTGTYAKIFERLKEDG